MQVSILASVEAMAVDFAGLLCGFSYSMLRFLQTKVVYVFLRFEKKSLSNELKIDRKRIICKNVSS